MARLQTFLTSLLLPVAALAAAVPIQAAAPPAFRISNEGSADLLSNKYIVVYNATYGDDAIDACEALVIDHVKRRNIGKRGLDGAPLSTEVHTLSMGGWRAMSLESDDAMIQEIMAEPEVAYVEADAKVHLTATVAQMNAPPGLSRLSNAQPGVGNYVFDTTGGEGITVYVVDTGVRIDHTEFEGRATWGVNTVDNIVCLLMIITDTDTC